MHDDLALALELADLADAVSMARYRAADLHVETKPDRTPVTEADQAVERELRAALAEARPGDVVLGEEYGSGERPGGDVRSPGAETSSRRWVIDPIDGTASYLRGMPTWATLIALQEDGQELAGVVSMPALGRRWWAARGTGAFSPDGPLHVSGVSELSDAQLCWSGIEAWDAVGRAGTLLDLARRCWRTRGIGDAWQYMLVAEGAADIALDPEVKVWDVAAVKVVVEEAGGRFSDHTGRRTAAGGSGLATNAPLHEAVLEALAR